MFLCFFSSITDVCLRVCRGLFCCCVLSDWSTDRSNQVFEGIVKDMLVKNGHRATVESVPNTELEATIDGKEKGLLDEVKKSMSDQVNVTTI